MPVDPQQLAILEQALAESPTNVTLRVHVAGLFVDLGDDATAGSDRNGSTVAYAAGLAHAQQVLAVQPDHVGALSLAARAAAGGGEGELASRYRRIADALGVDRPASSTAAPAAPPTPPPAPPTGSPPPPVSPGRDWSDLPPDPFGGPVKEHPSGQVMPAVNWAADGSHDDIDGERPFYVSISEDDDQVEILTEMDIPDLTLDDVGGLENVKRRLRTSFLAPLQNPELREMYRKSLRGGMLLYGPPGCGKTFLARAVAGELHARFFSVGLHDILDMYLGNSEKNLHEIFETARRHQPCVLFLDEVDALGHKRSNFNAGSGGRNVVVQLLNEMDGLLDNNEGIFVIGATNQPWDIDAALRRPGRFDRMVLVLPPDAPARATILAYHLRDRPVTAGIDLHRLAARTPMFSGADLRLVCEGAAEIALEDSLETGRARPIDAKDLDRAIKDVVASTRPWFETARNFAQFANEGGRYDDLIEYLRSNRLG